MKFQRVAGQRPQQGTKSCSMGRNSIHPSIHPFIRTSICWSVCLLSNQGVKGSVFLGLRACQRGLRACQRGLEAYPRGLRACQRGLRVCWTGLRDYQRGLRACKRGLRVEVCVLGLAGVVPFWPIFIIKTSKYDFFHHDLRMGCVASFCLIFSC